MFRIQNQLANERLQVMAFILLDSLSCHCACLTLLKTYCSFNARLCFSWAPFDASGLLPVGCEHKGLHNASSYFHLHFSTDLSSQTR